MTVVPNMSPNIVPETVPEIAAVIVDIGATRLSALGKGLALLTLVVRSTEPMSASELAAALSLSGPTTHRVLAELESQGWIGRRGERGYGVGPDFLLMAAMIAGRDGFAAGLRTMMRDMVGQLGETVCLNMIDRRSGRLVVVAVEEPARPLSYRLLPGDASPLHAGASGKAALASMTDHEIDRVIADHGLPQVTPSTVTEASVLRAQIAEIRQAGYALSRGERLVGSVGLAVPLSSQAGGGYGSLLLTVPEFRFTPADEERLAGPLRDFAERISHLLVSQEP